jgi:hypothetical protein
VGILQAGVGFWHNVVSSDHEVQLGSLFEICRGPAGQQHIELKQICTPMVHLDDMIVFGEMEIHPLYALLPAASA